MVRGNWQRRVEKTEARRTAAKKQKELKSTKGEQKKVVELLFNFLEIYSETLFREKKKTDAEEKDFSNSNNWVTLHIWIDTLPSDSPCVLDLFSNSYVGTDNLYERQSNKKKGKERSNSFNISEQDMPPGNSSKKSKKKSHPRSKESDNRPDNDEGPKISSRLCANHFYTGRCVGAGTSNPNRKGKSSTNNGCQHLHYSNRQETLANILMSKTNKNRRMPYDSSGGGREDFSWKESLTLSAEAAVAAAVSSYSHSNIGNAEANNHESSFVDTVYYLAIPLLLPPQGDSGQVSDACSKASIRELISKSLSDKSCGIGSIVYVAVNNIFLFDRYRGGLILTDNEFNALLLQATNNTGTKKGANLDSRRNRSASIGNDQGGDISSNDVKTNQDAVVSLPSSILEHLLTFLTDRYVPVMMRICRSWHNEIGKTSPSLWRFLLQRHNWPPPPTQSTATSNIVAEDGELDLIHKERNLFRDSFISNYSAVRDIRAVRSAMSKILGGFSNRSSPVINEEKEMVYQSFHTRRDAPQEPNICVGLKVWSSKRLLLAYNHDCTLRLFDTVIAKTSVSSSDGKNSNHSQHQTLREVVCLRVAPYPNTKKKTCQLLSMDLDKEMIGCLCCVNKLNDVESYFLTIWNREDFLCASGADDADDLLTQGSLHHVDVREVVLEYLLSLDDEVDPRLLQLHEIAQEESLLSKVRVVASKEILACGSGRFLLDISVWIPDLDIPDAADWFIPDENVLLVRKLFLFSSQGQRNILWTGDVSTDQHLNPHHVHFSCEQQQPTSSSTRSTCTVAITTGTTSLPLVTSLLVIEPSGKIGLSDLTNLPETTEITELLEENWRLGHGGIVRSTGLSCFTKEYTVIVHNLAREDVDAYEYKSIILFHSRLEANNGNYSGGAMKLDFESQIVMQMESLRNDHVVLICHTVDSEEIGSHHVDAILINVQSRTVIQRTRLLERTTIFDCVDDLIPMRFASSEDAVGAVISWRGVVITGQDVRFAGENFSRVDLEAATQDQHRSAKKKKKKQKPKKMNKKDGFARGMSLRG